MVSLHRVPLCPWWCVIAPRTGPWEQEPLQRNVLRAGGKRVSGTGGRGLDVLVDLGACWHTSSTPVLPSCGKKCPQFHL